MTNYERLLNLPFGEVLREFNAYDKAACSRILSYFIDCDESFKHAACDLCCHVAGGCDRVMLAYLDEPVTGEYFINRLTWHDVKTDLPFTSDTCIDYLVVISGATAPTLLCYDGSNWLDDDGNRYCVTHWMPLPELPW